MRFVERLLQRVPRIQQVPPILLLVQQQEQLLHFHLAQRVLMQQLPQLVLRFLLQELHFLVQQILVLVLHLLALQGLLTLDRLQQVGHLRLN
jgi:hypothetical protein